MGAFGLLPSDFHGRKIYGQENKTKKGLAGRCLTFFSLRPFAPARQLVRSSPAPRGTKAEAESDGGSFAVKKIRRLFFVFGPPSAPPPILCGGSFLYRKAHPPGQGCLGKETQTKKPEELRTPQRVGGAQRGNQKRKQPVGFFTANDPPSLIELPPSPSYCGQAGGQARIKSLIRP